MRAHVPWYWRTAGLLLLVAGVSFCAALIYAFAQRQAGLDRGALAQERDSLSARLVELEREVKQLRGVADAGESREQIERTAQQQMANQLRVLEAENGQLKEDLSVFENLARKDDGSLGIHRLRVEPEIGHAGQYRYRMLLAMQGGKEREFKGQLQLVLDLVQDGRSVALRLPSASDAALPAYQVDFRYFKRIEGGFPIPADARLKGLEVRLLQGGTLKASRHVEWKG